MDLKTGASDPWMGHYQQTYPVVPDFTAMIRKSLGLSEKPQPKKEESK